MKLMPRFSGRLSYGVIAATAAAMALGAPALAAPKAKAKAAAKPATASRAAPPKIGEFKIFGDWAVACDNIHECAATGLMQDDQDWSIWLTLDVDRAAGAQSPAMLNLSFSDSWPDTYPAKTAVRFMTDDGTPLAIRPSKNNPQGWELDLDADLVARIKNAKEIWLQGNDGRTHAKGSLNGFNAAMLHIDAVQGRTDGETALVAKGATPASAVPAAPPEPKVRRAALSSAAPYAPTDAEWSALETRSHCATDESDPRNYERETYRLDATTTLVALGCGAGAYNRSDAYYIARGKAGAARFTPAPFDQKADWLNTDVGDAPVLINSEFRPETLTLVHYNKGRGLGDCGTAALWVWDGKIFRLIRVSRMEECRGSINWPRLWTADDGSDRGR